MQHEQLINDLLDGELDSAGEATLFGQLANDSELRAEFMQQLLIRNAVQNDRATLVPPIPLTSAVFAGLGFAAPLAGAAATAGALSQTGGMFSTWLAKLGIPIVAALASAGITFAVLSSGEQPLAGDGRAPSALVQEAGQNQAAGAASSEMPSTVTVSPEPRVAERIVERIIERPSPVDERLLRENEALRAQLAQVKSSSASSQQEEPSEMPLPIVPSELRSTIDVRRLDDARVLMQERLTPIADPLHVPAFSLLVRGLSAQSPGLGVLPQTSWRDNIGIAMLYRMTPTDAVGIEVGAESFPMVFSGQRNQQQVQFEMQPLVTWAGITYRHVFPEIGTSGFSPFAQALVGGTEFGPIGRASAGIVYSPVGSLSFMFGIEGSALGFTHQRQWFTSTKYGFTYGVAVRL